MNLDSLLPPQSHYYVLKLEHPSVYGPYAVHGGPAPEKPDNVGLLVFPLREKAEQYCLILARKGKSGQPPVFCIPEKLSAVEVMRQAATIGGIALNDTYSNVVKVLEMARPEETSEAPMYLLTHQGRVQRLERSEGNGVIFARSEKAAKHAAKEIKKNTGKKVAVAEIGTIPGETLEGHLRRLMLQGDLGTWIVASEEGPLKMHWLPFDQTAVTERETDEQKPEGSQ